MLPTTSSPSMCPLSQFKAEDSRHISVVLTDIDDTLTTAGIMPAIAYEALERLQNAGIITVAVTGRPAGWCDMIARFWPIDAVVGENGAFYFKYNRTEQRMIRCYHADETERAINRERLDTIRSAVLREVPDCRISADQPYREADLAVDFAEDVPRLTDSHINQIVALFEAHGATAKVSSIHVNGWFGNYDKLVMTKNLLRDIFALDPDAPETRNKMLFVGDSPNDEPMFQFFTHSVGVANLLHFAERMTHKPAWITNGIGGEGFAELVEALLRAKD